MNEVVRAGLTLPARQATRAWLTLGVILVLDLRLNIPLKLLGTFIARNRLQLHHTSSSYNE
jgi:hypothetical protein